MNVLCGSKVYKFIRRSVVISGDMLDEVTAIVDGYNAYFSFSKVKTGYSGKSEHLIILIRQVC